MSLYALEIIYGVVFGLLIGSFLNVVITRMPKKMFWEWKRDATEFLQEDDNTSPALKIEIDKEVEQMNAQSVPPGIAVERSFCPQCKAAIAWYDNIPLISYLILGGKCRSCKKRIPIQYPAVEAVMAVLGGVCVFLFGGSWMAVAAGGFCAVLLVCTMIDLKYQIIPDKIVLPAMWIAIAWALTPWANITLQQSVLGAIIGYMILWSVFWMFKIITKKDGMGYGDFKFLALIGAFLGPFAIMPTLLIATVSGSIIGLIIQKARQQSTPYPFGPFLAIGAIGAMIFGTQFNQWIGM